VRRAGLEKWRVESVRRSHGEKKKNVTTSGRFGFAPASNKHSASSVMPSLAALAKQLLNIIHISSNLPKIHVEDKINIQFIHVN
jgi:hypothetical protein